MATAEQVKKSQEAQRAANEAAYQRFAEATARGGDTKSIEYLKSKDVPVVTVQEGPYTRTYVGKTDVSTGLERYMSGARQGGEYGIIQEKSSSMEKLNEVYAKRQEQEQEQEQARLQQLQQASQIKQQEQALQYQQSARAYAEFGAGQSKPVVSTTERVLPSGDIEIVTTKQVEIPDTFKEYNRQLAKKDRELERMQIRETVEKARSIGATEITIKTKEGETVKKIPIDRAEYELFKLSRGKEPEVTGEFIVVSKQPKDPQQLQQWKENKQEIRDFISGARQSGASTIIITEKNTGKQEVVPIERANLVIARKSRDSEIELSYKTPEVIDLNLSLYERVERGITPKPKDPAGLTQYYIEAAGAPIGDIFFPVASMVTGKEQPHTPSTVGKTFGATIESIKYGFSVKDSSGKPLGKPAGEAFTELGKEIAEDPLKTVVQIPAEIGITMLGGRAVQLGTKAVTKIAQPVITKTTQRKLQEQLTEVFTGRKPREIVKTTFEEPVVQKSVPVQSGKQTIQAATEVVVPVTRKKIGPEIKVTPEKSDPDLFRVEGGKIPNDKEIYIKKTGDNFDVIVKEPPLEVKPRKMVVAGQVAFSKQEMKKLSDAGFELIQVGKKQIYVTSGKPNEELLKLVEAGYVKPVATVSKYPLDTVIKNAPEFKQYLFGRNTRTQLEEALLSKEVPVKAKPTDEYLLGVTKSFGQKESKVGLAEPQKIKQLSETITVKHGKEAIPNPVKRNIENIERRIALEKRELDKLDPNYPANPRDNELIERNIRGLEKRRLELKQKPDMIEVTGKITIPTSKIDDTTTTKGFVNYMKKIFGVKEDAFKAFETGTVRIFSIRPKLEKVGGDYFFEPFHVVKGKFVKNQPVDSYVTDVIDLSRKVGSQNPFMDVTKSSNLFRGSIKHPYASDHFKITEEPAKGVASGAGRTKSLLEEKIRDVIKESARTSSTEKIRQDAFGPITTPQYMRAYPAMEIQGASVLEPQSITAQRPKSEIISQSTESIFNTKTSYADLLNTGIRSNIDSGLSNISMTKYIPSIKPDTSGILSDLTTGKTRIDTGQRSRLDTNQRYRIDTNTRIIQTPKTSQITKTQEILANVPTTTYPPSSPKKPFDIPVQPPRFPTPPLPTLGGRGGGGGFSGKGLNDMLGLTDVKVLPVLASELKGKKGKKSNLDLMFGF